MEQSTDQTSLTRRDVLLLGGFCAILFGFSLSEFRPLTMHEAVLPQCSREMLANGDWLIPRCGGRPWLERPPLPMWLTAGVANLFGGANAVWKVRLSANLAGMAIVLLTAQMSSNWFGRRIGLLAGFCLATMVEFTSYAWLAEQDIFLCLLVTMAVFLFSRLERRFVLAKDDQRTGGISFFGSRQVGFALLFASIGITNLAKGMLFGPVMALLPIVGALLWNFDWRQSKRYAWFWGWLIAVGIAVAWPIAVLMRMPNALELWLFDHVGRLDGTYQAINQPFWYYFLNIPWEAAPWTPFALIGLFVAFQNARKTKFAPERLFLCWAILPVIVFTFASGKHHHYMLHILPAWSVLGSIGIQWCWKKFFVTRWPEAVVLRRMQWTNAVSLVLLALGYIIVHATLIPKSDGCIDDTKFLALVKTRLGENIPIAINDDVDSMESFRNLFYLDDKPALLHNLTYLLDQRYSVPKVRVLTRAKDRPSLEAIGTVTIVEQSAHTRRESSSGDRLTLFELEFHTPIARYQPPAPVSPMQAMHREKGPFLGGLQSLTSLRR